LRACAAVPLLRAGSGHRSGCADLQGRVFMRSIRLDLEYEGSRFHGWQLQPGVCSVQETLEDAFFRITRQRVRIVAAGRTDAGVHALGQVAHLRTDCAIQARQLLMAMNSLLPEDVVVKVVSDVPAGFDARKSALEKRYEYWIWNHRVPSVFSRRFAWHVKAPLHRESMCAAAAFLTGTRDFSSFRASGCSEECNPVRIIHRVEVDSPAEGMVRIVAEGVSFLRHMVRIMVGTLVEVGLGKRGAEEMAGILEARDRRAAGRTAPAKGLFLVWVRYPGEEARTSGMAGWGPRGLGCTGMRPGVRDDD